MPEVAVVADPVLEDEEGPATLECLEVLNKKIDALAHVKPAGVRKIAEWSSASGSSVLAGVVGGVFGIFAGLGYGAGLAVSAVVTGSVGLLLGCALGVLVFRGRAEWRLDRLTMKTERALVTLEKRIIAIESCAPPEVVAELWAGYRCILETHARESVSLLVDHTDPVETYIGRLFKD